MRYFGILLLPLLACDSAVPVGTGGRDATPFNDARADAAPEFEDAAAAPDAVEPVQDAGTSGCTSHAACGLGGYCDDLSGGRCLTCAADDEAHCGNASSPPGCQICSGSTPECSAGACACVNPAPLSWVRLDIRGAAPSPRKEHSAIYDAQSQAMIVFAGDDGSLRSDLWSLALSGTPAWTRLTPTAVMSTPSARSQHGAVYNARRRSMLVFGGDEAPGREEYVWELALVGPPAWTGGPPDFVGGPSTRKGHWFVQSSRSHSSIMFGGDVPLDYQKGPYRLDLDVVGVGNRWFNPASGTRPSATVGAAAIYDPIEDRIVQFGGAVGTSTVIVDAVAILSNVDGQPNWGTVNIVGPHPSARRDHSAVYDSQHERMLVYGGFDGTAVSDELWSFDVSSAPRWTRLTPAGTAPGPRRGHTAIYDEPRDRMIIFGGDDTSDVYALEGESCR